jgi:hypothetical protein
MTFVGALLLPSLIAYYYDERLLNGISVWVKPLKFQFSEIMLIATILIAFSLIEPAKQDTSLLKIGVNLVVVCGILEVLYIMLQAARGVASHYNNSTKLEAIMYPIMGVGAILMVVGAFIVGYVIFRTPKSEQFEGFRLGSALGLMLGAVFTLIAAGILSGNVGGHWVGGIKSDIGGVPFLGWSRTGGDLRVAHFFATHLMQVLPILGLISMKLKQENQRKVIFAGSLVGIGVVLFTLWQAKQGLSFF